MAESTQVDKVSWWHMSIADWELENPEKRMNDCATHFKVSPSYLSIIRNSDSYKVYIAQRRREHNERVSEDIIEKVEGLAKVSLDVLQERIVKERANISLGSVQDSAKLALNALGFGVMKGERPNAPAVNIVLIQKDDLARARDTMRRLNGVVEVEEGNLLIDGSVERDGQVPTSS